MGFYPCLPRLTGSECHRCEFRVPHGGHTGGAHAENYPVETSCWDRPAVATIVYESSSGGQTLEMVELQHDAICHFQAVPPSFHRSRRQWDGGLGPSRARLNVN